MSDIFKKVIIIYDDREMVSEEICSIVGNRRYGDIIFKRKFLHYYFRSALPKWVQNSFFHIRSGVDLEALRSYLEAADEDCKLCIFSAQAGYQDLNKLTQLIERFPYAQEDFTDLLYKPKLVYLNNAHWLVEHWSLFEASCIHKWEKAWQNSQRVSSIDCLDLGKIRDFLLFITGATATRHFNELQIDSYYYTKSSTDKNKMLAEYSFYHLVPERMKPWLIQTFDYSDVGDRSSYKMLRYYLADSALQWVHESFSVDTFNPFIDRLLFFINDRNKKACDDEVSSKMTQDIFLHKVKSRVERFLQMEEGRAVNSLAANALSELDITVQMKRYERLFNRYEKKMQVSELAVGHGDPCFSNILYDQQRYILKLIDPKGAVSADDLWAHPLYDLCKISHSVLGDYDFVNNGLYKLQLNESNHFVLKIKRKHNQELKKLFVEKISKMGVDYNVLRLGEASLFLSMLPLHMDYPNKIISFMLIAKNILDEIEYE